MPHEAARLSSLRCADQDRELVAQVLNNAYAQGRLTFDEHTERIAHAYDALTFGDLDVLTDDLVAASHRRVAPAPMTPPAALAINSTPGEYTGGNAILSTLKPGRIGTIASEVTINAWLGEVRLDLIDATFAAREMTLNVGGLMCEVRIRVPAGVEINTSQLSMVLGESKVDGTLPRPGGIRINLVGTVVMGEVKVLGPETQRKNRYEKFVK